MFHCCVAVGNRNRWQQYEKNGVNSTQTVTTIENGAKNVKTVQTTRKRWQYENDSNNMKTVSTTWKPCQQHENRVSDMDTVTGDSNMKTMVINTKMANGNCVQVPQITFYCVAVNNIKTGSKTRKWRQKHENCVNNMKTMSATWTQCQQHENSFNNMKTVNGDWVQDPQPIASSSRFPALLCSKKKTFPITTISFSPLPFPLQTTSISGFGENTQRKILRHKIILQCCAHPLEQVARHTLQNTNHLIFSAAAEITVVSSCLSPSLSPFLYHLHQAQRACGCLHGVKLSYTSGHRRWLWHENTQTVKSKSAYFNETITKICPHF